MRRRTFSFQSPVIGSLTDQSIISNGESGFFDCPTSRLRRSSSWSKSKLVKTLAFAISYSLAGCHTVRGRTRRTRLSPQRPLQLLDELLGLLDRAHHLRVALQARQSGPGIAADRIGKGLKGDAEVVRT